MNRFTRRAVKISRRNAEYFMIKNKPKWFVYILECSDGTYYTGVTKDLSRRLDEHNTSKKGAKYTRSRRPVKLLSYMCVETMSEALKVEASVKKKKRKDKLSYLSSLKQYGGKDERN